MDIQNFFESLIGQVTVVGIIIILFGIILYSGKGKPIDVKALSTSAVLVALSSILNQLVLFEMPQGGSVTLFSMIPIVLCAYLFGVRRGLMAGMCVGLISLIFNPYIIHPIQLILDYPIAFGAIAMGGIFRKRKYGMVMGYAFGILCRYMCAVLSGVIFFSAFTPEGFSPLMWSLWYNITYLSIEGGMSMLILLIPQVRTLFENMQTRINNKNMKSAKKLTADEENEQS